MLAKTFSYGLHGLDPFCVTIETDISKGLPAYIMVGLPDNAVKESKERVRSALKNSGYKYPPGRKIINLCPADLKKEGPRFDLAIAIGLLAATEQVSCVHLNEYIFLGELALDGTIHPVTGALTVALNIDHQKFKGILLPEANAHEAALAGTINVYPISHIYDAVQFLQDPTTIKPVLIDADIFKPKENMFDIDFCDVKGQFHAKRGIEIAAAGMHNILMNGPPGSGKSMLAKRLVTILPDMNRQEALETTNIYSATGNLKKNQTIITQRPFRSPHHTTSDVAIVGGGSHPKPGEITLAHNGILFLDEMAEFNRNVLESLRQPLEDKNVTIARAQNTVNFPAKFMLVCAMNPCPCGWLTNPYKKCVCSTTQVDRYKNKISGPLLDRVDIHIDVPYLPAKHLLSKEPPKEKSIDIKTRVLKAHKIQNLRFKDLTIQHNSQMNQKDIKNFCVLNDEGESLLREAIKELHLSARSYDKILKVARTIADVEDSEHISEEHIAEAISYRNFQTT